MTNIATQTRTGIATNVAYRDRWAMATREQDAVLIAPSGELAATFVDYDFGCAVADLLNAVKDAPLPDDTEYIARADAAEVHELLRVANERISQQVAEIAALRKAVTRGNGYLRLMLAIALDPNAIMHGNQAAGVTPTTAANCEPAAAGVTPTPAAAADSKPAGQVRPC